MSLTAKILVAMAAGIAVGGILNIFSADLQPMAGVLVEDVFYAVGRIFLALLQMMVVPLVFVSLVCGVASLGDLRALGRLGTKIMGLYLATTCIAIVLSLLVATSISPGDGFELAGGTAYESLPAPRLADVIINIFPVNPVRALADGEMLQIIVFALLIGTAMTLAGEPGRRIARVFEDLNEVIMRLVLIVIHVAPIGVFALVARTFATQGFDVFVPLVWYVVAVLGALLLHLLLTYTTLLRLAGLSLARFFAKMRVVAAFAFSTASSSATIPLTLETVEKRMGVRNSVAAFTVPLGATVNMDGTAIMQGVATVFVANVYGVDLAMTDYLMVVLTATLASIATAAVPGAGLIMLAMVLAQVGLPIEGIGLIVGVDRLLDMARTVVNVCGDAACTCVVARSEGALDLRVYDDPQAELEAPQARHALAERRISELKT
jgi:Na+/H+-dicarboxylate symporter